MHPTVGSKYMDQGPPHKDTNTAPPHPSLPPIFPLQKKKEGKMIALKAIQSPIRSTKPTFQVYHTAGPSKWNSTLRLCCNCKSTTNHNAGAEPPPPEGDNSQQEVLARIAMLQAQKLRLTGYLDETSAYLTRFAEEANQEFDQIGEDTRRELDEAGDRIMENIEKRIKELEEAAPPNKMEAEKKLAEFEGRMERELNEGLFFKSLRRKSPAPQGKAEAKEEIKMLTQITKETAESNTRRKFYLALMGLLAVAIVNAVLSSYDWQKVVGLGAIWAALLSQFIYEQRFSSEAETTKKVENEEEKK